MPRSRGDGKLWGNPWAHLRSHLSEEATSPDNVGCKVQAAVGVCCLQGSAWALLTRIDKISFGHGKLPVSYITYPLTSMSTWNSVKAKVRFLWLRSFISTTFVQGPTSVTSPVKIVARVIYWWWIQLSLSVQRLRTLQQKKEAQAKSSRRDIATLIEKGKIETARIKIESSTLAKGLRMSYLWITTLRISNSSYQWRYSCRVVGITRIILRASFGQVWPLGPNVRYMKIFEFLYLIWIHPTALESRTQVWLCFKQRWSDACTKLKITGVIEGVCIVIHAAPRTEVKGMVSRITLSREPNLNYLSKELHILRDILMHKYGREFSIAVMENRDGCVSSRVSLNN